MTTEPMPIAEVSSDLYARCLAFVQDQSSGEWGEFIEGEDAKNLFKFVVAERATALADAERKLASAKAVLKTLSECPMSGWTIGQAMARQFLAAQDGDNK